MADQKRFGSKILGIFVEQNEAPGPEPEQQAPEGREKTPAELVAELASTTQPRRPTAPGPTAAVGPPATPSSPARVPPGPPGAAPDFNAVFQQAGMDAGELDRVKKAEDLLKTLPDSTPHAIKKQIVEASLKAFGFEIEKIVSAAQNQKRALDTYVKVNETSTAKSITDAEAQIRALTEKIALMRAEIEKRTGALTGLTGAAHARKAEVQRVIDFFQSPAPPPAP